MAEDVGDKAEDAKDVSNHDLKSQASDVEVQQDSTKQDQ